MTNRSRLCVRGAILSVALVAALFLFLSWRSQTQAQLSCTGMFEPRHDHNGYLQINVLGPHPTEEYFKGQLFLYYPSYQDPQEQVRIVRGASGSYAPSILTTQLVPFSKGLATPRPLDLDLPTPGVSQRRFPLDSAVIDMLLTITPPIRPATVIVRNLSPDFIPRCQSFSANWTGPDQLRVVVPFSRNPFVQGTVVLMAVAVVVFALLLALIRETGDLAVATASYFFSVWSIRGIVAPPDLGYSSLLDLWLMGACILVLFVVGWRLTRGAQQAA
jgi:hypothetical protein